MKRTKPRLAPAPPKRPRGRPRFNPDRLQQQPKEGPTLPRRWTPKFLQDADTRFANIRAVRARIQALEADTAADSVQKKLLCQHAGFLSTWLETQEVVALERGTFDSGGFVQAMNSLLGLLRSLGLERKVARIGLKDYLRNKGA